MKVLVTGATGLLGRHLVRKLCNASHNVIALGRNQDIGNELNQMGALFVPCDLSNRNTMMTHCLGTDAVIHCGALSKPWGNYPDFYDANVIGTKNIVECALESNVKRFIHISSPSIYFNFRNRLNIIENSSLPKKSVNYYVKTKKEAEKIVDDSVKYGLETITLRPRAIFGPYDTTLFPRLLNAIKNSTFPLINDGKAIVDITYVENVVDAIMLAIQAPSKAVGYKFNITNDQPIALKKILDMLFELLGIHIKYKRIPKYLAMTIASLMEIIAKISLDQNKEPRFTRYSIGVLAVDQTLNIQLAKDLLGYSPKVSIEQGLATFATWWKANHDR
jgi:nucleoside-diphosphate-sugar epimerase